MKSKKISNQKTGNAAARSNSRISSLWLASGLSRTTLSARRARRTLTGLAALAAMMTLLCSAAFITTNARAQGGGECPTTDTLGPWYGLNVTNEYIPCWVQIGWCWRIVGGNLQIWIDYVVPMDPTCDSLNPVTLINTADSSLMHDDSLICALTPDDTDTTHVIPYCPSELNTVTTIQTECWKYAGIGPPSPAGVFPQYGYTTCWNDSTEETTCYKSCSVCCTRPPGHPAIVQYSDCSSWTEDGSSCPPPPPLGPWLLNQCYDIGCGGWTW